MAERSFDAQFFEAAYARNTDPWGFETSDYERDKYAATVAALAGRRFASGFEIGCSIGVLTARLADVCETLLAVDFSERALALARRRNAARANVTFERMAFPQETPSGSFDFVIVSEVGYYWSDADLRLARERIVESAPGGLVELVHFTPHVAENVRDGDAVHAAFLDDQRFAAVRAVRAERYRIDLLRVR